ncbi:hypothetical protein JTB14_026519 [Gonioctena quinquepunctata]|nr:hypothetical protein JTB14_026519 [Gonioctena quinquepunctata]
MWRQMKTLQTKTMEARPDTTTRDSLESKIQSQSNPTKADQLPWSLGKQKRHGDSVTSSSFERSSDQESVVESDMSRGPPSGPEYRFPPHEMKTAEFQTRKYGTLYSRKLRACFCVPDSSDMHLKVPKAPSI